jgi:predicted DNA-binding transcriptional regulator YafY
MEDTFARLVELLRSIPRVSALATPELEKRLKAKGFKVYPRMVQRDLQYLQKHFPIECDERSRPFGWRWRNESHAVSLAGMTPAQALSFHLAETYLRALMPSQVLDDLRPYFTEAKRTLGDIARPSDLGRWPARIRVLQPEMPLMAPKVLPAVHAQVTEALLLGHQLTLTYRNGSRGEAAEHRIHPLALIQHGRVLYVVARFYEYDEPRMIALHRVAKARRLEQEAAPPKGFTLEGWLAKGKMGFGGPGTPLEVELEFNEGAGRHLLESPLSESQRAEDLGDGRHRITATVQDTERLRWWLLGFGARVEVLAPTALRDEIAERVGEAALRYRRKAA